MVDWCVGNSVSVDQTSISTARLVMHHLIQEAVQAKRQSEIANRYGTTLAHFIDHVNEAYDATTAPWSTYGPRPPSESCSNCIFNQSVEKADTCLLSDHLLPDDGGISLSTTHGCDSCLDPVGITGFHHRETTGRLNHEFFKSQGFTAPELSQVYRILNWLLRNVDCDGAPFVRYTENKNSRGIADLPPGSSSDDLWADMEANQRAVTILDVERWERFLEERFGRRSDYNLAPTFSRQRSDWGAQGNLDVDVHLIVGEFVGRLVSNDGKGKGLNQYSIRDRLYDRRDHLDQVSIKTFYQTFDSEQAGHMTETFLERTMSDQNAARYRVVNPGTPTEAVKLDPRHVRHHDRLLHHRRALGGGGGSP